MPLINSFYSLFSIISSPLSSIVKIFCLFTANIVKHIAAMVVVEFKKIDNVYSRKLLALKMRNSQLSKTVVQIINSAIRKFTLIKLSSRRMPINAAMLWAFCWVFIFGRNLIIEKQWKSLYLFLYLKRFWNERFPFTMGTWPTKRNIPYL